MVKARRLDEPRRRWGQEKITEDQAREMVLKDGSAAAAMKAAKEQGLEFE